MKLVGIYVSVVIGLVLLPACKKDNNNSPTGPIAQKLIAGRWQISASTATIQYNGKDTTIDYYSQWRACEQDDFMEYGDDGHAQSNENTDKCPEDEQVADFSWELKDNDTRLQLTLANGTFNSTGSSTAISEILELTDTQLKLRSEITNTAIPFTTTETFKNIK